MNEVVECAGGHFVQSEPRLETGMKQNHLLGAILLFAMSSVALSEVAGSVLIVIVVAELLGSNRSERRRLKLFFGCSTADELF